MTENFNFEWFDRNSPRPSGRPRLGIQKRGTFSLNSAGYEGLGSPTHIKLAFDSAKQVIGIKAGEPDSPGSFPIRKQPNSSSYLFAGTAFANRYGILLGQPRRYWGDMHGDLLTVDLNQEPDSSTWPPKRRDEFGRISTADNESAE